MTYQPAWECDRCPGMEAITAPTQSQVDALRNYHLRTKHGEQQALTRPVGRSSQSTGSKLADVIGDFFEGVGEGIGKILDDL